MYNSTLNNYKQNHKKYYNLYQDLQYNKVLHIIKQINVQKKIIYGKYN